MLGFEEVRSRLRNFGISEFRSCAGCCSFELVRKVRMERLIAGSRDAEFWFRVLRITGGIREKEFGKMYGWLISEQVGK